MVGILFIAAGAVLLIAYFYQQKNQNKGSNSTQVNKTNLKKGTTSSNTQPSAYTKNTKNEIPKKDLFDFMEFEKIQDDMIIQDKGSKFTMVIQCKGINYDLMSEVEQLAVEEGFITFLNTLTTPIQLYVQARAIDLKTSLNMYKDRVNEFNKEYEEINDQYNKLANSMNTTEEELGKAQIEREKMFNISEYAHDITRYVEKLSLNKHMLQRKFYVVLSYYKSEVNSTTKFTEEELADICYRELYTRAQGVISALQTCSVAARILDSNELAELIYITYNRDDQKLLDIRTALESGFYRMYSTSKDVHEKKNDLLKKQIQEEAMNRLETAIKLAIEQGKIEDPLQREEDLDEDIDKTALAMAEELDMPEELRDDVQEIIYTAHQERTKQRRMEVAASAMAQEVMENSTKEENASVENEEKVEEKELKNENVVENQKEENIEIKEEKNVEETNIDDSENDSIV